MTLFFLWWFKEEPALLMALFKLALNKTYHYFSISYLLKTLFLPWKRDIKHAVNPNLREILWNWVENLVSRVIGFIVRIFTIFSGLIILILVFLVGLILIFLWYILPFLALYLLFYGIYLIMV